jgi:hypothetical protein
LLQVGFGQRAVERRGPVAVSFTEPQRAVAGFAQPRGIREQGSKDGFQLARRTRNDAQHLGRSRLLFQRLSSLPSCLGKLPPCLVSLTLCFRKLAGPGFQLLLQSFD